MKKSTIIIIVVVIILGFLSVGSYNGLVETSENSKTAWSNVESSYQRRNDLIGNLVKTVQGAADFERSTLVEVQEARSKATSVTIDPTNLTPETMAQYQKAQSGLTAALNKLMVSVERYPDLKANQNFLELQSQLEGTENRINVERNKFNETVNIYNKKTKTFPSVLVAKIFGFAEMGRFEAEQGAEKAPDVEFNF
uniref:LemA family protein n=1 Tax=Flavobacterium sp. TaxID=239 RepID=UPI0040490B4D